MMKFDMEVKFLVGMKIWRLLVDKREDWLWELIIK